MTKGTLKVALLLATLWGSLAVAETIVIDDQVQVVPTTINRPGRGLSMTAVEAKFGAPQARHDAVGIPPITRWDYAGFSVFFEKNLVIDAVAVGS